MPIIEMTKMAGNYGYTLTLLVMPEGRSAGGGERRTRSRWRVAMTGSRLVAGWDDEHTLDSHGRFLRREGI